MRRYFILVIIFLFSFLNFVYGKEEVSYYSCVDGDTIKIMYNGDVVKVRLLAVDTPESVKSGSYVEYYGREASVYTCNRVKEADKLELEFDFNSDMYDKYDRLLAWVFIDGNLLQEELVENGYAEVAYLYGDYMYTDILLLKEKEARKNKIGIWKDNYQGSYRNEVVISSIVMVIVVGVFLGTLWFRRYHCGKVSKIS